MSATDQALFSTEELAQIRSEFATYDVDDSGNLDASEVQVIIEKANGKKPSMPEVEYVMKIVDKNKNKVLEFDEFLQMIRYVRIIDNEAMEQFQFFDKNGDGYIQYSELKKSLKDLNERLSKSEVKLMMKEADVDKDGKISFEEFRDMIVDPESK